MGFMSWLSLKQEKQEIAVPVEEVQAEREALIGSTQSQQLLMSNGWRITKVIGPHMLSKWLTSFLNRSVYLLSMTPNLPDGLQSSLLMVTQTGAKYRQCHAVVQPPLMPYFSYTIFITLNSMTDGELVRMRFPVGSARLAVYGLVGVFLDEPGQFDLKHV